MNKKIMLLGLTVATFLSGGIALAEDQSQSTEREQNQVQKRQTVGRELMTPEERQEHRAKMRSAATKEERSKVRAEQREKMKKRAEEQGKSIPENPPAGGMGGGLQGGMGGGGRR